MNLFALQKALMTKRRREVYGVPFDPKPSEYIKQEEEYDSHDYDSDDIHSTVYGDSSGDNKSTADEHEDQVSTDESSSDYSCKWRVSICDVEASKAHTKVITCRCSGQQ